MVSASTYVPDQPFFKLSTQKYISRFGSTTGRLAQYYSFIGSAEAAQKMIAVPDGTIDIIFQCSETSPQALVCGSVKKGKQLQYEDSELYFGARFYPAAAEPLLGCPLDDFTEKEIILSEVEKHAENLAERITSAGSFEERIELFESYHLSCNQKGRDIPPLVHFILDGISKSGGEIQVQDIADDTGYSARHINNMFKKHVGISPKLFIRIVRFQRCFGLIRHNEEKDFATIAHEAGYYDQAHFINEFREFSLTTPTRFLQN